MISVGFISCYDNVDNSTDLASNIKDAPVLVNTAVTGLVWSDDSNITDYDMVINDAISSVEAPQEVFFNEVQNVNKKGQAIYVRQNGQMAAMMHTQLIENDINYLEIELFAPFSLVTPNNSNPININSNITVAVDDDKIRELNNTANEIEVLFRDLSSLRDLQQLGKSGYDHTSKLQVLNHYKAFEFRVSDALGETLQLDESIIMNIQNTADNAQLYHFDEEEEQWHFAARLKNGSNRIVLSEAGFFSVCVAEEGLYSEGRFVYNDEGIAYHKIQCDYSAGTHHNTTSLSGKWLDIVPTQSEVKYSPISSCEQSEIVYSIMTAEADITNQEIVAQGDNYVTVKPAVYQCNGERSVLQALAVTQNDKTKYYPLYNDESINVEACVDEYKLAGYDIKSNSLGVNLPWSKDINVNQLDLLSCNSFTDGYSYIQIGEDKMILEPFIVEEGDKTVLKSMDNNIRFKFNGNSVGMYDQDQVNLYFYDETFGGKGFYMACENSDLGCGFDEWNVTHFKAGVEKWVRISFGGEVWIQTLSPAEAGYFNMKGVILCKAQ